MFHKPIHTIMNKLFISNEMQNQAVMSPKWTKTILYLLLSVYILVVAFHFYKKEEILKKLSDPNWQYFTKVVYGTDPGRVYFAAPRWDEKLIVRVVGNLTDEDKSTVENCILQFKELTGLKVIVKYRIGKFNADSISRWVNEQNPLSHYKKGDFKIIFQDLSEMEVKEKWMKNTYAMYFFQNFEYMSRPVGEALNLYYSPEKARFYIRTDSTTQAQRNNFIIKGLSALFLCKQDLPLREHSETIHFNASGQHHIYMLEPEYEKFMSSAFNPRSEHVMTLAEVDKFILKTLYSTKPEKLRNELSIYYYSSDSARNIYFIYTGILFLFILTLFFSGVLHRSIFYFIDNHVYGKWLRFELKVLFIVLVFLILSQLLSIIDYYTRHLQEIMHTSSLYKNLRGSLISSFILSFCLVIPANLIYVIENIWLQRLGQFAKQQIFSFLAMVVGFVFSIYLIGVCTPWKTGNYYIPALIGGGLALIRFFYNYATHQKRLAVIEKDRELNRLRELKTRAELNALQSKINPHFLYNALNSIAGLAHESADKTEQMALALSKLFRYSINKDDDDFTTVQNEVEMVSIYLDIEKVRFGDKFEYLVHVEKDVENERIPKFIIQPLVENAIKHGISKITGAGLLRLNIQKLDESICIKVSDNGPGFPEDMVTGYGLQNIYEKLDILYPGKYDVKLQNGSDKNIIVVLKETKNEHEGTETRREI